jgi:hypothetical protein
VSLLGGTHGSRQTSPRTSLQTLLDSRCPRFRLRLVTCAMGDEDSGESTAFAPSFCTYQNSVWHQLSAATTAATVDARCLTCRIGQGMSVVLRICQQFKKNLSTQDSSGHKHPTDLTMLRRLGSGDLALSLKDNQESAHRNRPHQRRKSESPTTKREPHSAFSVNIRIHEY